MDTILRAFCFRCCSSDDSLGFLHSVRCTHMFAFSQWYHGKWQFLRRASKSVHCSPTYQNSKRGIRSDLEGRDCDDRSILGFYSPTQHQQSFEKRMKGSIFKSLSNSLQRPCKESDQNTPNNFPNWVSRQLINWPTTNSFTCLVVW